MTYIQGTHAGGGWKGDSTMGVNDQKRNSHWKPEWEDRLRVSKATNAMKKAERHRRRGGEQQKGGGHI